MSHLYELLHLTVKLKELLEADITSNNREEIIDETNRLIEERGKYLEQIKPPPFTEEEQEIGKQIIDMNVFIKERMDLLFADLKKEMKQVKQKKQSNRNYVNPYKSVQTVDGMFMDKKK